MFKNAKYKTKKLARVNLSKPFLPNTHKKTPHAQAKFATLPFCLLIFNQAKQPETTQKPT
jgi:hypothetical protein